MSCYLHTQMFRKKIVLFAHKKTSNHIKASFSSSTFAANQATAAYAKKNNDGIVCGHFILPLL